MGPNQRILKTIFTVRISFMCFITIFSCTVYVVCLLWSFYVPLENFSLTWRRHHFGWRTSYFDPCSAHMAIEQWGVFSVTNLLWHGIPFIKFVMSYFVCCVKHQSSPRTCYTHTCCRAIGSGAVTTCYDDLGLSRLGFEHPAFRMLSERYYRLRHRDVKVV